MPTQILVNQGTPIVLAHVADYSDTGSGYTVTHELDLTSLAAGAAWQSDAVDFGDTRPVRWTVDVGIEFNAPATVGKTVDFYLSAGAIAGKSLPGGCTGTSAAYALGLQYQMIYIGSLVVSAAIATTVQRQVIASEFYVPMRYGVVVPVNNADQAFEGDAVEMFVAFVPHPDESQ